MADDFETNVLTAFATHLDQNTSAHYPKTKAPITQGQPRIVLEHVPKAPDDVLALSLYGVTDDGALSDSTLGLQITVRRAGRDPLKPLRLAGEIFDALHGLHDADLPVDDDVAVHVVQCLRQSHTSIGPDSEGRWRRVQNFYVDVHRPSPHRQ